MVDRNPECELVAICDIRPKEELGIDDLSTSFYGYLNEMLVNETFDILSVCTYGDSKQLPKVEDNIGAPLSPYAVTKLVSELYAKVFSNLYGIDFIWLRCFNIFESKQDSNGAYAAVIPLFYKVALKGKPCYINGDGSFSRDYTYVDNAVQANTWGFFSERNDAVNQVYNVACGGRTTLLELWDSICLVVGKKIEPTHRDNWAGDIPHSLADVSKSVSLLGYKPEVKIQDGIKRSFTYFNNLFDTSK